MNDELSRRNFRKVRFRRSRGSARIMAGPDANNRLKIGWIGTGSRGYFGMGQMYEKSTSIAEVVAVCDTYKGNLNRPRTRDHQGRQHAEDV